MALFTSFKCAQCEGLNEPFANQCVHCGASDNRVGIPVNHFFFKKGDAVEWINERAKLAKSAKMQEDINLLASTPVLVVYGTQTLKKLPALFDHENSEYFQMLSFDVSSAFEDLEHDQLPLVDLPARLFRKVSL